MNLETGATQTLGTGRAVWSPDGRWIAISSRGHILVMEATDLSRRKKLGPSGVNDRLIWSPDSKRLLFAVRDRRCFLQDDLESLAVVDVETGKRQIIESSRCMVTSSAVGWVDPQAVR